MLVAEDEPAIADAVAYAFAAEGFDVDVVADGVAAANADVDRYDVLILDVMLPKLSGVEACRRIRERSIVPIVMLTARVAEVDRVLGLESGADDYISKPFSMPELISRVRAILRRRSFDRDTAAMTRDVGGITLDLARQALAVDGREVDVTPSEFRLLELLAREPERVFTRDEIVAHLWRSAYVGGARTCDGHVKNLRRKIERDPARPERLATVRGVGYMLRAV
jgi:two-component system, OmpR family, response regulator RegX3